MTLFVEVSGHRIVDGRITVPSYGAWHADVTVENPERALPSDLVLTLSGLTLKCVAWRPVTPYQGKVRVRLIGGRGGWGKIIPPKHYRSAGGVRLSLILTDAARLVGERVAVAADRVIGFHFLRDEAPAGRILNRYAPGAWWIDPDGTTRVGVRATSKITSALSLISFDGARGVAVVATEKPADFVPGRTFQAITLPTPITIGGVTHTITKGALRTEVLAA